MGDMYQDIKNENNKYSSAVPPGYKSEKIGVIPDDWQMRSFRDIFKVNQGLQIPISERLKEQTENSYFYITNEFIKNRGKGNDEFYIHNPSPSVICKTDDILMTRTGNTGIVLTGVEGVFHNNFFKISFDRDDLHKDFIVYYLKSYYVQKMIRIYAGASTILDLNHSDFYRIYFPYMRYDEQQKIASILSTWDKAIKLKEKLIEQKKEQKKGLLQKLLTGEVRLPGFKGSWEKKYVGDLISESKEVVPEAEVDLDKRITVKLNLKGIEKRGFSAIEKEGATTQYLRREGQFIYGKQNLHKGAFGLIPKELDGFQSSSDIPAFDFSDVIDPLWFYYYFAREDFYTNLERISTGTGSKRIQPKNLYKLPITVPDIAEQRRISQVLLTIDNEIELLTKKLNEFINQKKGLMQNLLTGKVRVKV